MKEHKIELTAEELEEIKEQAIDNFASKEFTTFDKVVAWTIGVLSLTGLGTVIYLVGVSL